MALLDLITVKLTQFSDIQDRSVNHFTARELDFFLEDRDRSVLIEKLNPDPLCITDHGRLFTSVKISLFHVCNTGFGIRIPGFKTGWMLLGVSFYRVCRPAVGVAFPQHRVDGTAQNFCITGFYGMLCLRLRIFRIVRKGIALALEFADGILELRHGSTDVGEFDDVRFRRLGQFPEFRQVVRILLLRC